MSACKKPGRGKLLWIVAALFAVAVLLLYRYADPTSDMMPQCLMKRFTGLSCPGCGSQRFLHALLNGRPMLALSYNYFLPIGLLLIIFMLWLEATRHSHPDRYRRTMRPALLYLAILLMVVWTVVRNILSI